MGLAWLQGPWACTVEPLGMRLPVVVARVRIQPPALSRATLQRPRLHQALDQGFAQARLGALVGGPGSGKTTLAVTWAGGLTQPVAWYEVAEEDDDEATFLGYLLSALERVLPLPAARLLEAPVAALCAAGEMQRRSREVCDSLLNALQGVTPLVVVIDEAQRLRAPAVLETLRYLLRYLPATIRVLLVGRRLPDLADWGSWRVRGQAWHLEEPLAFEAAEVEQLVSECWEAQAEMLDPHELWVQSGGWPLALDLLCRQPPSTRRGDVATTRLLTDYVAAEVWPDLEPADQHLLLAASVLGEFSTEVGGVVSGYGLVRPSLQRLAAAGLVQPTSQPDTWRVQGVLREHLLACQDPAAIQGLHARAAQAFLDVGGPLRALPHLLATRQVEQACAVVLNAAPELLASHRCQRVLRLCELLGDEIVRAHAEVLLVRATALRQTHAFEAALADCEAAGQLAAAAADSRRRSEALLLGAEVYVDTVQPSRAAPLLRQAFRLLGTEEQVLRARALDLMAENSINQGCARAALRYRRWSRVLQAGARPGRLDARLLLRTGQLSAARAVLDELVEVELTAPTGGEGGGAAHRDTVLIRAYLGALQGEAEAAVADARQGLATAQSQGSAYSQAVSWMRLGHALQLASGASLAEVTRCYAQADLLAARTGVARLSAEALMGRALACSRHGDVPSSYVHATEGLLLTRRAGDRWLSGWLQLAAGLSGVRGGHPGAGALLDEAQHLLQDCRDAFGVCLAELWKAVLVDPQGDAGTLAVAAQRCAQGGYGFLLQRSTLFGPAPSDLPGGWQWEGLRLPPAGAASSVHRAAPHAAGLAEVLSGSTAAPLEEVSLGLARASSALRETASTSRAEGATRGHDGSPEARGGERLQLRVQVLGALRIWRGSDEVAPRAFKREKARELFLMLLSHRGEAMQKEVLQDLLWPDADLGAAQRDFRVALHALSDALDPGRPRQTLARWVEKRGQAFVLPQDDAVWVDADEMAALLERADTLAATDAESARVVRQRALELYRGDFLQDYPYAEWSAAERERLRLLYLQGAEKQARQALEEGDDALVLGVTEAMLRRDRCWEVAYRLAMQAHARQGRRFMAARMYEECVAALLDELGVEPADETRALYDELLG